MKRFKVFLFYANNFAFDMEVFAGNLDELTERLSKTLTDPNGRFYKQREGQRLVIPGRSVTHFVIEEVKSV